MAPTRGMLPGAILVSTNDFVGFLSWALAGPRQVRTTALCETFRVCCRRWPVCCAQENQWLLPMGYFMVQWPVIMGCFMVYNYDVLLLWLIFGLLWGTVACYVGQLCFPGPLFVGIEASLMGNHFFLICDTPNPPK